VSKPEMPGDCEWLAAGPICGSRQDTASSICKNVARCVVDLLGFGFAGVALRQGR
jgi:hypothetical protein